ncbi:hypothetical protein [Halomarina rubra]|uniref:Uncharacterized protein n=1 Tax=Halomarina rubra TaxID=2071873 RepID=A0ABD6AUW4_9EURY|nr:hypothetical protein [Halomarina rubra]
MERLVWGLAVTYLLVTVGLLYALASGSNELFLALTYVLNLSMVPLAYLVYRRQLRLT